MRTMQAAIIYGQEDVRIEQVPIPEPGRGEVRIRVGAALTCGTDVKVFRRGYHARMIRPPSLFGHEMAGTIDAPGPGVIAWHAGQRVVSANSAPCGACFYCLRGRETLCEDLLFFNGAYAEYAILPERIVRRNLLPVPGTLSFAEAALAEPLACAVRGMDAMPAAPGETIAVIGAGPIGLFFVRLCAIAGARVIAVGRRAPRLRLALELGATEVIDVHETPNAAEEVRRLTEGGRGADKVIEAVGAPAAWEAAIAMARKAGIVSLFGGCPAGSTVSLDTHRVHYEELTLLGTFHHTPDTVRRAVDLLASGEVPAASFLQARAPLDDLPNVLCALAHGQWPAVKTAILPG